MSLSPEQLNDLRRRVLNNEPWTEEELVSAVKQMTVDRIEKLSMPAATKSRAKKTTTNLDDLL